MFKCKIYALTEVRVSGVCLNLNGNGPRSRLKLDQSSNVRDYVSKTPHLASLLINFPKCKSK